MRKSSRFLFVSILSVFLAGCGSLIQGIYEVNEETRAKHQRKVLAQKLKEKGVNFQCFMGKYSDAVEADRGRPLEPSEQLVVIDTNEEDRIKEECSNRTARGKSQEATDEKQGR